MWSSQLWLPFKQSQIKPEKCFWGFNEIQSRGLCVSAAVLHQLSYKEPYVGSRPIYWVHRTRTVKGMKHTYASFLSQVRWTQYVKTLLEVTQYLPKVGKNFQKDITMKQGHVKIPWKSPGKAMNLTKWNFMPSVEAMKFLRKKKRFFFWPAFFMGHEFPIKTSFTAFMTWKLTDQAINKVSMSHDMHFFHMIHGSRKWRLPMGHEFPMKLWRKKQGHHIYIDNLHRSTPLDISHGACSRVSRAYIARRMHLPQNLLLRQCVSPFCFFRPQRLHSIMVLFVVLIYTFLSSLAFSSTHSLS